MTRGWSSRCLRRWKGASVSSAGRDHLDRGLPCQDASGVSLDCDLAIVVVSDGAGSAKHSEHGAAAAVEATTKVLKSSAPWTDPVDIRERILVVCQEEIARRAHDLGCPPGELAATLAFVAATRNIFFSGNLGDGIVVAAREDSAKVLLGPTRGEFANETVFLTSRRTSEQLHIIKGRLGDYDGFAAMSDGAAESLYQRREGILAPALSRIFSWSGEESSDRIEDAIRQSVMPLLHSRTGDDCSLGILQHVNVSLSDLLEKSEALQMELLEIRNVRGLRNRLKVLKGCQKDLDTRGLSEFSGLSEGTVRKHRKVIQSLFVQGR